MRRSYYSVYQGTFLQSKQKGIVLLSCIIFILVILMIVKISLRGSIITEQKSGIDQDMVLAQQSAQLATRAAEKKILGVLSISNIKSCQGSKAGSSDCHKKFAEAVALTWALAGNPSDTTLNKKLESLTKSEQSLIRSAAAKIEGEKGIYYIGKASCNSGPLWKCVKWSGNKKYFASSSGNALTLDALEASDIVNLDNKYDISPRYIIERFLPGEIGMPPEATVLFRITAAGFGQSGNSDENVTHSIYQANYIL